MQFNRKEFERLRKAKPIPQNTELQRAAPQMQALTNSEEWNKYLSYLEPIAVNAENLAKDLASQLLSPIFDAEKLFYLKSEYIKMTERAETVRVLMNFPKEIIELGNVKSNPYKEETIGRNERTTRSNNSEDYS